MKIISAPMKYKWLFIPMFVTLLLGSLNLSSCVKDDVWGEEMLGSSRPNYNMHFDIAVYGLYMTEWYGRGSNFYSLTIKFDRSTCDLIYNEGLADERKEVYYYQYNHPLVTLTTNEEGIAIIKGTTISGGVLKADEVSFVDEKNKPVLARLTRRK